MGWSLAVQPPKITAPFLAWAPGTPVGGMDNPRPSTIRPALLDLARMRAESKDFPRSPVKDGDKPWDDPNNVPAILQALFRALQDVAPG